MSVADQVTETIVAKLRDDLKPRREWRVTKARLESRVEQLERLAEGRADRIRSLSESWHIDRAELADTKDRADYNGRLALAGWACTAGLVIALAWVWH